MDVMTVLGPIEPPTLSRTLMHEHVLVNFAGALSLFPTAAAEMKDSPLDMTSLGRLHRNPFSLRENVSLADERQAIEELTWYKEAGGRSLVELTSIGIGRNVQGLRRIANATGIHIVAGCGWYRGASHPPYVAEATIASLTERIVKDLTDGIDNTGIRAGIIGEIGTSSPVTPTEAKVLQAASRAQRATGASLNVHISSEFRGIGLPEVVRLLKEEGVPPERVILSHMDEAIPPERLYLAADEGFNIEFDCFGHEYYYPTDRDAHSLPCEPRDVDRLAGLGKLIARGHLSQLLVSQDVFLKMNLRQYGGWGYDHILTNVIPMAWQFEISDQAIEAMLTDNPCRILPF